MLDCLTTPLSSARTQALTLRSELERNRALLHDIAHSLTSWAKDSSHMLDASVWRQLPPQEARMVAELRAQLRALALRSCYASAERSASANSTASTSRRSAEDTDEDTGGGGEVEGAGVRGEGWAGGQEVCNLVNCVLEGLSASCRVMVQLQQDKEDLERKLELQVHEAKDALAHAHVTHSTELRTLQQQMEQARRAQDAQRELALEELAATRTACTASETSKALLQTQVAIICMCVCLRVCVCACVHILHYTHIHKHTHTHTHTHTGGGPGRLSARTRATFGSSSGGERRTGGGSGCPGGCSGRRARSTEGAAARA